MKRFILAFSMFSVWLAIASTYYVCVIKGLCNGSEIVEESPVITKKPIVQKKVVLDSTSNFASAEKKQDSIAILESTVTSIDTLKISGLRILDDNYLLKAYYSNFRTYKNSTNVRIPMGISEYGYVIAKHMDSVNSALLIKGYYNQEETSEQGTVRATYIKDRLTKLGIPETLINIASVPAIYEYNNNKFIGGIQFDFKKTDTVFRLKRVDYTLFKNIKDKKISTESLTDIDTVAPEIAKATNEKVQITEVDMEAITKKESVEAPLVETKIETKPIVKKEKISFTVTNKDFRNNKFKASKSFKKFIETHKTKKSIQLVGYSNTNENTTENYNKGLELANLVKSYMTEKSIYSGKISTNASKNEVLRENESTKEGVTLIIQ